MVYMPIEQTKCNLKTEAAGFSEMSTPIYCTMCYYIP